MDLTALLMVAVAKSDGDMSAEEKREILALFQSEFHLSKRNASDLMVASVFLLKDGAELRSNLPSVVAPSLEQFTKEQAESALKLVNAVATIERQTSEIKQELVKNIERCMAPGLSEKQKWS